MDDIAVTLKLPAKSVTQKRTLTQRSDSSGSESSSPLDKRLKNSTHAEHEGEVQEVLEGAPESPLAVDMSEKWTEKLDEILVKLNKLDKRRMISFVFTSKQSGIYFLRKFVSPSTLSCLFGISVLIYGIHCLRR